MGFSPDGEEIVLDDDLSIFVGENNSGKSGIGRAITFIQDYWKGLIVPTNMDGFNICFNIKDGGDLVENITHFSKKASEFEIEFKLELEEPELSLITDELIKKSNQIFNLNSIESIDNSVALKTSFKDISICAICKPPFFDLYIKLEKYNLFIKNNGSLISNISQSNNSTIILDYVTNFKRLGNDYLIFLDWLKDSVENRFKSNIKTGFKEIISFSPFNETYSLLKDLFLKNIVVFSEHRMLMKDEPYFAQTIETLTGQELSSVLYNLKNHRNDIFRSKYRDIVKIFKDMFDMELDVVHYKDDLKETKIKLSKNGHSLNIEDCGAGIFENLFIITNLCNSRGKIFFIEEPEQHLHPHAQGLLINFFEKASNKNQLLLTTHSLIFADPNYFENIHIVRWDKSTRINNIDENKLEKTDSIKLKMELEDFSKRSIFFSRCVLLVDGDSELCSFPLILRKLNFIPEKEGLLVLNCGGSCNYPLFYRFAKSLNLPCYCIFDNDAFKPTIFGDVFNLDDVAWNNIQKLSKDDEERIKKTNKKYADKGAYVLPGHFESTVEKDGFGSELRRFTREVNGSKRIAAALLTESLIKDNKKMHHFEEALNSTITYFKKHIE